ncbi:MAG: hypothetical protein J0H51_14195 [Rhizobiales bacterium]|nr:hypothetical protein [Hyphomicrobiales bacterium]
MYDLERFVRGEQPSADELEKAPRLTRWYVKKSADWISESILCLSGIVSGHSGIPDGDNATTSALFWLDSGRKWARTRTQIYALDDEDIEAYAKGSE